MNKVMNLRVPVYVLEPVERSPGVREVCGSIPGHVKQKTLKFELLLLDVAFST